MDRPELRGLRPRLVISTVIGLGAFAAQTSADAISAIDFETYTTGTVNGQVGWSSLGAAGSGCAIYDHLVVTNLAAPLSFGNQSLRISNAVTSGCFGDQTFSSSLVDAAGEVAADAGLVSGGTRQSHFEAQWDFASTVPGSEQPGLAVVASPDRGDGARMSWIQMADTPAGLAVNFYDYRDEHVVGTASNLADGCGTNDDFFLINIASGLDRTAPHTIKVSMDFLEGPRNDVVRVWVDGALVHTDTSWEDYFRFCEATDTSRTVDSILFRTAGAAAPATAGKGFLIDNLLLSSGPIATTASAGVWELFPEQVSSEDDVTTTTLLYQAKVRSPINADGSSNFPKRRGVIPVQFDLESATKTTVTTTTTTGPVVFESIGSDGSAENDYAYLSFSFTTPITFADLNELVADYSFTQGNCGGGSLRWSVRVDLNDTPADTIDDPAVYAYLGDMPNFTDCTSVANNDSGENLIGSSDARFDLSSIGGPFYATYADALALIGGELITRASLVVDGGWLADQKVALTGASVDGAQWTPIPEGTSTSTSDTTTGFVKTCALPQAMLKWSKVDGLPDGAINEGESIQPKDTGVYYRFVDCKYIYNLDVSSFGDVAGRNGTYWVWVNIDGKNVNNSAKFDLR
jgi:hypothetical protein